jgi:hypothetical protein
MDGPLFDNTRNPRRAFQGKVCASAIVTVKSEPLVHAPKHLAPADTAVGTGEHRACSRLDKAIV